MLLTNGELILIILAAGCLLLLAILVMKAFCLRKTGKSIQEQNHFLETLINSIPSPVFYKNSDGIYLGCNRAFLEILGLTKDEVVGKTVYDLSPSNLADVYKKADDDLFAAGGEQRYETQVRYADGVKREILFSKSVFLDAQSNIAGLLGVMLDITDRKKAEEALRLAHFELEQRVEERTAELAMTNKQLEREIAERLEAERESREKSDFLHSIINSIDHGLVVVDAKDFSIRLANDAAMRGVLFGSTHCHQLHHGRSEPCGKKENRCPVHTVKISQKPSIVQHKHRTPDGNSSFVEIHSYPVFDEKGEVVQVIENIMDITERKEAELAMVEAKNLAETTSRLMSEFLDTVSHELRTPMTSVHGFAKLIDKKFDKHFDSDSHEDQKMKKAAQRIKGNLDIIISESERLTELINDHLDLSKLEAGRVEWKNESVVPGELVERAQAATSSLFEGRTISFEVEADENLPTLSGDSDRLLQVLINLISNAEKFTESGSVVCSAKRRENDVLFSVKDTGIGLPANQYEQIFTKFSQLQSKESGKPAGTGLGLAISKKIVEHHDGEIWVESVVGAGSSFFFAIPIK